MGFTSTDGCTTYIESDFVEDRETSITFAGTNGGVATGSSVVFVKSGDGDANVNVSQGEDGTVVASVNGGGGGGGEGGEVTFTGTDGSSYTGSRLTFQNANYSNVEVSISAEGVASIGVYYV